MIAPGLRIGRYEVGKRLGKGGFGVVHVARDVDLDREIAIKVLKPEYLTRPQIVQRFLQEARAAAKIGHAGIVTVFECGQIQGTGTRADGNAYIAMELLVGESLSDRLLNGGRMRVTEAIGVTRQLAGALAAAHAAGIVHRDLKPDNVFLVPDAAVHGGERVKILDFGVAKLLDPGDGVNTHSQMMLGTPKYMSPEQARSAAKVDHRSDIYTLGCMLFEMLAARAPFQGDSGEQLIAHQKSPPPSVRAIVAEVPAELDALIQRMLAKDAGDRPQSMTEVVDALAELTDEPETLVRPPIEPPRSSAEITTVQDHAPRARSAPRIDRKKLAIAAGLAGVAIAGVAIVQLRHGQPRASAKVVESVAQLSDARVVEVRPPPAVADAAVADDAPALDPDVDRVRLRCKEFADKQRWADLVACAEDLRASDSAESARLYKLAHDEQRAEAALRKLGDAVSDGNLVDAKAALDAISSDSVYRKDAKTAYDAAAESAIRDLVSRAKDCNKLAVLLRKASVRTPAHILEQAREEAGCDRDPRPRPTDLAEPAPSPGACKDADELVARGQEAFSAGQNAAAFKAYEAAYRCRPETRLLLFVFASACKSNNVAKARLYWKRMSTTMQNQAASFCVGNGITMDNLNAP